MRLYDLTTEYQALLEIAERDGGNEPDADHGLELSDALTKLEGDIETKAAGIAKVLANLDADAAAYGAEERRLAARRKTAEGNAERLRSYLRACMQQLGACSIKGATFSITLSPGPDKVEVDDMAALAGTEFLRTKTVVEPDKHAILAAYKQHGEMVPGTRIVPTTRLVIR